MQSFSDIELMTKLAEGSKPALGELFLRHHKKVFTLAYRTLADWNTAEDVTQETFLRIWNAAPQYKPSAEFTTWLCRIVVNLCFDEKRRNQRRTAAAKAITEAQQPRTDSRREDLSTPIKHVWRALMKLNERQLQAVILHKFHGLSYKQIADRTGCTQSAVESLLVRAYRILRAELVPTRNNHPQPLDHAPKSTVKP